MSDDLKKRWMALVLESGLQNGVIEAENVLEHAAPKDLAEYLPAKAMATLLQRSLQAGALTPDIT